MTISTGSVLLERIQKLILS